MEQEEAEILFTSSSRFWIFVKTMLSVSIDEILKSLSEPERYGKSYFYRWKF